jgi:hypothetical protein
VANSGFAFAGAAPEMAAAQLNKTAQVIPTRQKPVLRVGVEIPRIPEIMKFLQISTKKA